jgi:hypothetical protein
VNRYGYFSQTELPDESSYYFPLHAIFLLAELQAEESLQKVLSVLEYDDDFLDFWFGDFLTEYLWIYFYRTGFSHIDKIKEFIYNPGVNTYAKTCITGAMIQTVLHNPERREEIIRIYTDIFDYYLSIPAEDAAKSIDSSFMDIFICEAVDGKFEQLLPQIKELFDRGYVYSFSGETYESILRQMNDDYDNKKEVEDIYTFYKTIAKTWCKDNISEQHSIRNGSYRNGNDYIFPPAQPVTSVKIGRNDPCPCGSGKKYKKCCLAKDRD